MKDEASEQVCVLPHRRDPERPRRAAPNSRICLGHVAKVREQLSILATFDADADEWVRDQALGVSAGGAPVSGSKDRPLVINRLMTEHKRLAVEQLANWVVNVAEDRDIKSAKRVQRRSGNIAAFCSFLTRHHDWSITQPWVDDYAEEVLALGNRAWKLLHPSGRRQFTHVLMRCVEIDEVDGTRCPGNLWCFLTPDDPYAEAKSALICDVCGYEVSSDRWMSHGRKMFSAESETKKDTAA